MDIGRGLVGLVMLTLTGLFDYWVWSNLLSSGLGQIGALVGFGILAFISIPVTIFGFVGFYLVVTY